MPQRSLTSRLIVDHDQHPNSHHKILESLAVEEVVEEVVVLDGLGDITQEHVPTRFVGREEDTREVHVRAINTGYVDVDVGQEVDISNLVLVHGLQLGDDVSSQPDLV